MKCLALGAAAGAAVVGLAACTSSAPSASPASSPVTSSSPSVAISAVSARCRQAYDTWQQGEGKGLVAALSAVGSAGQAGDAAALRAVLKRTKPALTRAARYPLPTCADPRGYWPVLLLHVNAAATTGSAASVTAAIKDVPTLTRELNAELNTELKPTEE